MIMGYGGEKFEQISQLVIKMCGSLRSPAKIAGRHSLQSVRLGDNRLQNAFNALDLQLNALESFVYSGGQNGLLLEVGQSRVPQEQCLGHLVLLRRLYHRVVLVGMQIAGDAMTIRAVHSRAQKEKKREITARQGTILVNSL